MQQFLSPEALRSWSESHVGQSFDVVLAGTVFGGRYGESPQTLRQATFEGETLCLMFNTTEKLTIIEPREVILVTHGLSVAKAAVVEFGWHSYGTDEKPEDWRTLLYQPAAGQYTLESTTSTKTTTEYLDQKSKYVVQLVRGDA
jgi:hypothetical protein